MDYMYPYSSYNGWLTALALYNKASEHMYLISSQFINTLELTKEPFIKNCVIYIDTTQLPI